MLVAAAVLGLYAWSFFSGVKQPNNTLLVADYAAIVAAATLISSFIAYEWTPHRFIGLSSRLIYGLLLVTIGCLMAGTGGISSPFIALWMAASVFAGVFGRQGIIILFIVVNAILFWQYSSNTLTTNSLMLALLAGDLPLAVGMLIWGHQGDNDDEETSEDKSYHELATQLSQVSGKSEVVINAIADGVIALDSKGSVELINPAAQQLIGWGKQDALGLSYKSVLKLVDGKNQEPDVMNDPITKALNENKQATSSVLSIVTSSGKTTLISIVVSPVGQAGSGVIIVFRDISGEKAEERQQAEFISTASHEMRTPVASIEGYLGLALNPNTATIDDKARDFITKAHASAQHLGRLFQDLLDVTKADDARLKNNPKVVDVVPFVHDIFEGLESKAKEKNLHFIYKPLPDDNVTKEKLNGRRLSPVFYVNVDNDHLREVMSNLIENAIKYTPSGDVVDDVNGDDNYIVMSIADTGLGIPREDQAHLFQKFYRVDNTDTREIGGTGLGLYLCRRLTETMGGRIWVESEYKKGSTFYVELPRINHEDAMRLIEQASIEAENAAAATTTATTTTPVLSSTTTLAVPPSLPAIPDISTPSQSAPVAVVSAPPTTPLLAPAPLIAPPSQPLVPGRTYAAPNIPLSTIEANPSAFISHHGATRVSPQAEIKR